ncbi:hypothetical protein FGG08_007013 [Glutinoglossum americanum]|uniref:UDP-N-acetylglucosamine transferase subunit ALG14 n=1 Tax=Glutinoglossum americanum TaxID=1670608 RepID=A0A9P8KWV7_9PEZI|nr:hypothetical protein FGG08_007013 [Glutinoglossum americanum]
MAFIPQPNNPIAWLTAALLITLTTAFLRLLYILPSTNPTFPTKRLRTAHTRLLVVLGSGGHTAEMFLLLGRSLNPRLYTARSYLVSAGDEFSAERAEEFERGLWATSASAMAGHAGEEDEMRGKRYEIFTVPRARNIHQSLLTTPFSSLNCCLSCFHVLRGTANSNSTNNKIPSPPQHQYPDLILCNGPGTAVCVIFTSLLLKYFGVRGTKGKMRTIYVESFARVRTLSLSGKILRWCCDRFLVQWKGLKGGGREYLGVLV